MDGMKLEPDSDSDNEPVSALCETELMDMKEEDSPSASASDMLVVMNEVQLSVASHNTRTVYPVIEITSKYTKSEWLVFIDITRYKRF
jgi:hypothetical protein